jgi:hypothetical protein
MEIEQRLTYDSKRTGILSKSRGTVVEGAWYELTIGIGNDHTARLLIDGDALTTIKQDAVIF